MALAWVKDSGLEVTGRVSITQTVWILQREKLRRRVTKNSIKQNECPLYSRAVQLYGYIMKYPVTIKDV